MASGLTNGQLIINDAPGGGGGSSPAWTTVNLPSDVINSNAVANTMQDITGLSFPVVAGRTYWFKFYINFVSALVTTGSRWGINGPNALRLSYRSDYSLTVTTQTENVRLSDYNQPAASNASPAALVANRNATLGGFALIEGVIVPAVNGTVIARFASEVANSAITAKTGSFVEYREIA